MIKSFKPSSLYRLTFIGMAFALFFLMPRLSLDFGITWDQWHESQCANLFLRYFVSGGTDLSFLKPSHSIYYNQPVYMFTQIVYGIWTGSVRAFAYHGLLSDANLFNYFNLTHIVSSLIGFVAILYTGLLTKKLSSWRGACFAFLLIALSPRFFGNAMNDPKDISFAAAYIITMYYLISFIMELPKPKNSTKILLPLSIGLIVGVRIGGLLLLLYLFLFAGIKLLSLRFIKKEKINWIDTIGLLILISLFGYFAGISVWPYGRLNPFVHPWIALKAFSNFQFWDDYMLFEGTLTRASQLPWYYLPKWILISSPVFVLVGIFIFVILFRRLAKRVGLGPIAMLLFAFVFPLFYIIYKKSIVYDSWRHVFFVYPPLMALIALAFDDLFEVTKKKILKTFLWAAFFLQLIEPAQWMIRNHPQECVYFSPVVGGIDKAFTQYETDYWGNSLRAASEWLVDHCLKNEPGRLINVRADGNIMSSYCYLRKGLGGFYEPFGYPKNFIKKYFGLALDYTGFDKPEVWKQKSWNFALVLPRWWDPEKLQGKNWPPPNTIHEIKADHATICAIVKNPDMK